MWRFSFAVSLHERSRHRLQMKRKSAGSTLTSMSSSHVQAGVTLKP
jgi:hypothetical protein